MLEPQGLRAETIEQSNPKTPWDRREKEKERN